MVNLFDPSVVSMMGDAAAILLPGDFYLGIGVAVRSDAPAFLFLKSDPKHVRPLRSVDEAVAAVWPKDRDRVRAYLTDPKRRFALEPEVLGSWVSGAIKAELLESPPLEKVEPALKPVIESVDAVQAKVRAARPREYVVGQRFVNDAGNLRVITDIRGAFLTYELRYRDSDRVVAFHVTKSAFTRMVNQDRLTFLQGAL